MKIRKVGVLGGGLMGSGIAEVSARAGYETVVREVSEDLAAKGRGRIEGSLGKAVERGKLPAADRDSALARISTTTNLEDLQSCDLVVEAVVEDLALKKETFGALDRICAEPAIFCSNTSSLTKLAVPASVQLLFITKSRATSSPFTVMVWS